jgi:hypothetical protein
VAGGQVGFPDAQHAFGILSLDVVAVDAQVDSVPDSVWRDDDVGYEVVAVGEAVPELERTRADEPTPAWRSCQGRGFGCELATTPNG